MRPVSAALLRTVRGSHTMVARARVCTTFQSGTSPTGTFINILGGDTQHDAKAAIRSTLDMTTDGAAKWPKHGSLLLAPYGNEIFVERGVQFGNGTVEWVSLGYYRIRKPRQAKPPDGPIVITGQDRMSGIVRGRLLKPVQYFGSQTYGDVVAELVHEVFPLATIQWDSGSTEPLGRDLMAETDRYGFIDDLITGLGKIWYWDHRGVLVIKAQPTAANPVVDITAGVNGVLVDLARELSDEDLRNAIVATGEGADTNEPVRAVVFDNNPASPTYYYGNFGPVPDFLTSPSITTREQAEIAATADLAKRLGLHYTIDFGMVPNPALEPWDAVRMRSATRESIEFHIIDRLTMPLTAKGTMTGRTREQTVVLIGVM